MSKGILVNLTAFAVTCFLLTSQVYAEDLPTSGIVYNTKETHSLTYACKKSNEDSLDCEFNQTRIRKKATPKDLQPLLVKAKTEFSSTEELSPELCKEQENFIAILHGKKEATLKEQKEYFRQISGLQKSDLLRILEAALKVCESKSEEDYMNLVKVAHDKDIRTCIVSSNAFNQSFQLVFDPASGARSWVAKSVPSGACGIIQLSRFEPETLKNSDLVFWKYIAKKAVTNQKGMLMPGMACKDLDVDEYEYDWRSKEHAIECDYIEFSPL